MKLLKVIACAALVLGIATGCPAKKEPAKPAATKTTKKADDATKKADTTKNDTTKKAGDTTK